MSKRSLELSDEVRTGFVTFVSRSIALADPESRKLVGGRGYLSDSPEGIDEDGLSAWIKEEVGPTWMRAEFGDIQAVDLLRAVVRCALKNDYIEDEDEMSM